VALEKSLSYSFGPFRLEPPARRLTRDGEPVALTARAFDTLVVLVENQGRVVTKEELIRSVWSDAFVEENNLNQAISAVRRALNDDGNGNRFIETVPRKGYTFVVPVLEELAPHLPAPATTPMRLAPEPAPTPAVPVAALRRGMDGRWLAAALVSACALGVGTFWLVRPSAPPSAMARIRSVAVLPFRPIVMPANDEFLGLALADSVITRLSRIPRLEVRPTGAIRGLSARPPEPVAAGRALRVDAVLDGQIQEMGDRVRVTLQLVSVGNGTPLWSERFDASRANLFELEDSIAEAVARELAVGREAPPRAAPSRPPSPAAYEAYLRGRYFWNKRTDSTILESQDFFRRAIEIDPSFASAWAGLADAHSLVGQAEEAKAAAQRAIELDPDLAEAHAALGNGSLFHDFDLSAAERHFQRAIALNPSYATAHQWYAYGLAAAGRFDEAVDRILKARALDPLSLSIATDVGDILYYAGRYAEAERAVRRALEMDEHFAQAHNVLGDVLLARNDFPGALREYESAGPSAAVALVLAKMGRTQEARAIAERLRASDPDRFDVLRAHILLELGERDGAFEELERAYRTGMGDLIMIGVNPGFAALRGDPRFSDLLRRLRLPAAPRA
jgi:DNA-binding winged helix-turn-helix (wHTH) protein/tetratricopeptide (TPR) repeat protein